MTQFFLDSFTDTDGTTLASHNADTGGAGWTKHAISTGTAQIKLRSGQDRVASNNNESDYYHTATPGSADYDVQGSLFIQSAAGYGGVIGRLDTGKSNGQYYGSGWSGSLWEVFRQLDPGGYTQIGTVAGSITQGVTYVMKLSMVGSTINVYRDGSLIIGPITDSNITAAGKVGLYTNGDVGTNVGIEIDDLSGNDSTSSGMPPGLGPDLAMRPSQAVDAALVGF